MQCGAHWTQIRAEVQSEIIKVTDVVENSFFGAALPDFS